MKKTLDLVEQH